MSQGEEEWPAKEAEKEQSGKQEESLEGVEGQLGQVKGAEDRDVTIDLTKCCHCDLNTAFFLSVFSQSLLFLIFSLCVCLILTNT